MENSSGIPLAFSLVVHRSLGQLDTLLSTLAKPRHAFCIYVDGKADSLFHKAVETIIECYKKKYPQVSHLYFSVTREKLFYFTIT